ncbi:MAG: hypothetical protein H6962_00905 [Chromatiaceae bacterium]|nr:hypothetical protein [Chromatiaceae bacterium]
MTEATDPEDFQKRLWDMFNIAFSQRMTLPQIDRMRWHVFPEIRIGNGQAGLFEQEPEGKTGTDGGKAGLVDFIPDIVRVMDMQQEQLRAQPG